MAQLCRLQLAINRVADWTDFSVEKSHAFLFRRTRRVFPEPSLTLYGCLLSVVREVHLEHVSEFGYVLDESGADGTECSRKLESGRRVADAIRFLINARDLQLQCSSLA